MWMRLAGQLGMSLKRCQQEVDSAEFVHWVAMFEREPWGWDAMNLTAANVAKTVMSSRGADVSLDDMTVKFRDPEQELSVADKIRMFAKRMDRKFKGDT